MSVIEVNHVTKEFQLGVLHSFKHTLRDWGARLRGKRIPKPALFKAVNDVSFSIEAGEVVGIIGHNGAGKSTLLKLLANISTPTHGSIQIKGKVAPLIEVGAGFIGDLTGRENVYLNGSILGLSRKEIGKKFDEIVAFAEMEEFIDTPVKRYSSGMKVKLAFSVATSIESEILIVDEVLAVGDLAFQRKCFDRMESLIKQQGKTVLLVSHNIRQVERLCSRVILMSKGCIEIDAVDPQSVCAAYYNTSNEKIFQNQKQNISTSMIEKSGEIEVQGIEIYSDNERASVKEIEMHSPLFVKIQLSVNVDLSDVEIVLGVHTTDFLYLFSATSLIKNPSLNMNKGIHSILCKFDDLMLTPNVYSLRLAIRTCKGGMIWYGENLLPFKVVTGSRSVASIPKLGILDIPYQWQF